MEEVSMQTAEKEKKQVGRPQK